jgi:hypothetical protein
MLQRFRFLIAFDPHIKIRSHPSPPAWYVMAREMFNLGACAQSAAHFFRGNGRRTLNIDSGWLKRCPISLSVFGKRKIMESEARQDVGLWEM